MSRKSRYDGFINAVTNVGNAKEYNYRNFATGVTYPISKDSSMVRPFLDREEEIEYKNGTFDPATLGKEVNDKIKEKISGKINFSEFAKKPLDSFAPKVEQASGKPLHWNIGGIQNKSSGVPSGALFGFEKYRVEDNEIKKYDTGELKSIKSAAYDQLKANELKQSFYKNRLLGETLEEYQLRIDENNNRTPDDNVLEKAQDEEILDEIQKLINDINKLQDSDFIKIDSATIEQSLQNEALKTQFNNLILDIIKKRTKAHDITLSLEDLDNLLNNCSLNRFQQQILQVFKNKKLK